MKTINRRGWIGVDIGTSTVKIAQLIRKNNRLHLAGLAIVARRKPWALRGITDRKPQASVDEMLAAASLHPNLRGRKAAVSLPMALCEVHMLDHALSAEQDQDMAVRQAVALATQRSTEQLQYATWEGVPPQQGGTETQTNVLTASSPWTDQLCDDVVQSGWICEAIDGLPFALARAVGFGSSVDRTEPVAAIDWGYGRATFCIVLEGRPVYVRCLKSCGMEQVLNVMIRELNVTAEEAQRLLCEQGINFDANEESLPIVELVREVISEPLLQLEQEIKRTISYLQGQRRSIAPKAVYLFGGGATVHGIGQHLSQRLAANVSVWNFGCQTSPDNQHHSTPSCLFGPAIALSALAWEQT